MRTIERVNFEIQDNGEVAALFLDGSKLTEAQAVTNLLLLAALAKLEKIYMEIPT